MSKEGFVQVAPDNSGKQIRNIQLDVQQPDGTFATVLMQNVVAVHSDGAFADVEGVAVQALLQAILTELRLLRTITAQSSGAFVGGG